ncbi:acyltransferase family protein, partial [Acidisphaera sp. L21]|uniref:acyltransferase family protein n=1 Tax=Acidisphaera sp. L21 TaxID=1641851 RepID=UPI0038CF6AA8
VLGLCYDTSGVARVLASPLPRRLGVISYSIYLVHVALLPVRDVLAGWFAGVPGGWAIAVVCTAALTLGLASLTYVGVEQPARRWLNAI